MYVYCDVFSEEKISAKKNPVGRFLELNCRLAFIFNKTA